MTCQYNTSPPSKNGALYVDVGNHLLTVCCVIHFNDLYSYKNIYNANATRESLKVVGSSQFGQ